MFITEILINFWICFFSDTAERDGIGSSAGRQKTTHEWHQRARQGTRCKPSATASYFRMARVKLAAC
jgi:hypothetical protein